MAFNFFTISFAWATFKLFMGTWKTLQIMKLQHNSDFCNNYFVSFFLMFLAVFYYYLLIDFWFIRLLNTSNHFIIMFSFNDFIHKFSFLFKDASWSKYLVCSNTMVWRCLSLPFPFFFNLPNSHWLVTFGRHHLIRLRL